MSRFIAIVTVIVLILSVVPIAACAEPEFYAKAAVVEAIWFNPESYPQALITTTDVEGSCWEFYWDFSDEPIEPGEVVVLLVWTCETNDNILDDEVIDVTRCKFKVY